MIATEIIPTTPSLPSWLIKPTKFWVIFFPKKGDDGPKSTSKIIAIAIIKKAGTVIQNANILIDDA